MSVSGQTKQSASSSRASIPLSLLLSCVLLVAIAAFRFAPSSFTFSPAISIVSPLLLLFILPGVAVVSVISGHIARRNSANAAFLGMNDAGVGLSYLVLVYLFLR